MPRQRIKVYQRVRSTNYKPGVPKFIKTTSLELCSNMIMSCRKNITPLRTDF